VRLRFAQHQNRQQRILIQCFNRFSGNHSKKFSKMYLGTRASHFGVRARVSEPNAISHAVGYAKHRSRSHDAVIRVYNDAGNMIETHEPKGEFREW
jgi:hypothetical protein